MVKKNCSIYIVIITIPIVILLGCKSSCRKSKEWFVDNEYGKTYDSNIESKYKDSSARYVPKFKLESGQVISIWNMDVYDMATKGDLVSKRSQTMSYFLITNNDTIVFYQKVCNEDVTDSFVGSIN